jgi:chromosome partitioning protein
MPYVVSVIGQKGGVGKTTTAMSLAAVASEVTRVLLVDADPQGSASWWARQARERLPFDVVPDADPANLQRLRMIDHDVVIVDTPGSVEAKDLLCPVLFASDVVVLPAQPAALTLVPLLRLVNEAIVPRRIVHRVLLNIVDPRSPADLDEARDLLRRHAVPYFQATVRRYRVHERAPLDGLVITQYPAHDRYSLRAVDDYRRVALELFAFGRPELIPTLRTALGPGGSLTKVDALHAVDSATS